MVESGLMIIMKLLHFLNLKDVENEKELLFSKLGAEHKDIAHIRIIEL